MNVIITAGGTSEPIDKVRKITNSGTGRLGKIIAEKLLKNKDINIFYICAKKSKRPEPNERLKIYEIETTLELKDKVLEVLKNNKIDYFIHSMAVSDYYVDYVSTSQLLSKDLETSKNFNKTILNPSLILDNSSKLSSYEDNLLVMLKKTPKIIRLIKEVSPKTILIGFKLLENVSKKELIEIATKLMNTNNCDYVIANDLKDITEIAHKAFIIDKKENIKEVFTKTEIAENINNIIINKHV